MKLIDDNQVATIPELRFHSSQNTPAPDPLTGGNSNNQQSQPQPQQQQQQIPTPTYKSPSPLPNNPNIYNPSSKSSGSNFNSGNSSSSNHNFPPPPAPSTQLKNSNNGINSGNSSTNFPSSLNPAPIIQSNSVSSIPYRPNPQSLSGTPNGNNFTNMIPPSHTLENSSRSNQQQYPTERIP